jgi:hypothetical protein
MKALVLAATMAVLAGACGPQPVDVDMDPVPAAIPASESPDIAVAIRNSVRYLEEEGGRWLEGEAWVQDGEGCVSCHHVGYALWSQREAERAGAAISTDGSDDLRQRAVDFLAQPEKTRVVSATQMIMAGAHSENDLAYVRGDSQPAGNWRARGQFPTQNRGEEESDDVASFWALVALATLEPLDEETEARRARALAWLARAEPGISNEWTAARLIVAHQQGDDERVTALLGELQATQHEDGGWSWLANDPSNPFSTGQTVYALAVVADDRARNAMGRGVDYLLASQQPDGTWETPSSLTSAEPSKRKDYIYRYWGTAWSSIGLSRVLGLETGGS